MRFVYTPISALDPRPRAYVQFRIGRRVLLALVDSGADGSVLTEQDARRAHVEYSESTPTFGVGGPVRSFRATAPLHVTIAAPRSVRGGVEWVEVGTHGFQPMVIPAPPRMPSLMGRSDLLVHYRFTLVERDAAFELTPISR